MDTLPRRLAHRPVRAPPRCSPVALAAACARERRRARAGGSAGPRRPRRRDRGRRAHGQSGGRAGTTLVRNQPLSTGDRITTDKTGRATLQFGSTVVRLGADSDLVVTQLDDQQVRLHFDHGQLAVRVRSRRHPRRAVHRHRRGRLGAAPPRPVPLRPRRATRCWPRRPGAATCCWRRPTARCRWRRRSAPRCGAPARSRPRTTGWCRRVKDAFGDCGAGAGQGRRQAVRRRRRGAGAARDDRRGRARALRRVEHERRTACASVDAGEAARAAGRRTSRALVVGARPGAGPGSTTSPGASRRSTTAAGSRSRGAGPGRRGSGASRGRSTRRPLVGWFGGPALTRGRRAGRRLGGAGARRAGVPGLRGVGQVLERADRRQRGAGRAAAPCRSRPRAAGAGRRGRVRQPRRAGRADGGRARPRCCRMCRCRRCPARAARSSASRRSRRRSTRRRLGPPPRRRAHGLAPTATVLTCPGARRRKAGTCRLPAVHSARRTAEFTKPVPPRPSRRSWSRDRWRRPLAAAAIKPITAPLAPAAIASR